MTVWHVDIAAAGLATANRNSIHPSFYVYSMYIGAELSRNRRENILLYTKVSIARPVANGVYPQMNNGEDRQIITLQNHS